MEAATQTVKRVTARLYQRISAQLILLLAFVGLAWFLVYFTVNSNYARQVFDELVNSQFRGSIQWSRVSWGPLPWKVKVLDARLLGAQGEEIIAADEVYCDNFHLLALLGGRIHGEDITLAGVRLDLRAETSPTLLDELGEPLVVFNIEEMFWPPGGPEAEDGTWSEGPHLIFESARILDAAVKIRGPGYLIEAENVQVSNARFELEVSAEDGMSMAADVARIPRGRVRVDLDEAPGGQKLLIPIESFVGHHYRWVESVFGLADVQFKTRGDAIRVKPFRMDLNTPDMPTMIATVSAQFEDVARHLEPLGVTGIEGPLTANGTVSGEVDAFQADFDLSGTDLIAQGLQVSRWSVTGRKSIEDAFQIDAILLEAYGATVTGQATFDPNAGDLYAPLEFAALDISRLPISLPDGVLDLARGPTDGRIRVRGHALFDPERRLSTELSAKLHREGPPLYGLGRVVDLDLLVNYAAEVIDVRSAAIEVDGDRVTTRGQVDLAASTLRLSGRFGVAEVRGLAAAFDLPIQGRVSGRYTVRGPLSAPVIEATFDGEGMRYEDYPRASIKGGVKIAGDRITLDDVQIDTAVGTATVRGSIRGPRLDLHVDGRGFDLAALPLPVDIGGIADARIDLEGTTSAPRISVRGVVRRPRFRGLRLQRLDIDATLAGDRAEVRKLELHDRQRRLVAASGDVDLRRGTYDGNVVLDRVPLDLVEAFTEDPLPVAGAISAELAGAGSFDDPQGEGSVTVHDLAYGDLELGDARLDIGARAQQITVAGDLFGDFKLDIKLPIDPGAATTTVSVRFEGLSLDRYVAALRDTDLKTRLSGELSVEADLAAGALVSARVELSEAVATYGYRDATGRIVPPPEQPNCVDCPTVALRNAKPVILTYRDSVVNLEQVVFKAAEQTLEIKGTLRDDGLMEVQVDGGLDLAALAPFTTSVFTGVEGEGSVSMALSGFIDNPTFFGTLRLDRMLLLPRSPVVGGEIRLLEPVQLEIVPPYGPAALPEDGAAPPTGVFNVSLPPLRTEDGAEGQAQVQNRFRLLRDDAEIVVTRVGIFFKNMAPQSLLVSVDGSAITITVPETARATVNLDDVRFEMWEQTVRHRRTETRLRLSGEVFILQAYYTADIQSAAEINEGFRDNLLGRRRASTVSVFERVPLLKRLMVDLRLRADNDVFVRNQVTVLTLDLEVRLRLALKGFFYTQPHDDPGDALHIAGFIEALEDSEVVYGRRDFEVLSGRVVFGSGNPQDLVTAGDFLSANVEASHTFRLRTVQGARTNNFSRGLAGDIRLEEVTLNASVRMATKDSTPEINLSFASNSGASQIDVATLVLTGSYPSDLTGAASAAPATEVLLGPLLNLIERPLEETLEIDLSLTPATTGTLFIDADKLLSRRLRLYTSTPVGTDDPANPQTFGLEYRINNITYTDLTNQQFSNLNSTSGRLRLRLSLD